MRLQNRGRERVMRSGRQELHRAESASGKGAPALQTPGLVRPQGASVAGLCGTCAGEGSDERFQTLGLVRPPGE